MVCHRRSCRRVAAAPIAPWVTFARDAFRFELGVPVSFPSSEGRAAHVLPGVRDAADVLGCGPLTTCRPSRSHARPPTRGALSADTRYPRRQIAASGMRCGMQK
jgi:hypothetical protein